MSSVEEQAHGVFARGKQEVLQFKRRELDRLQVGIDTLDNVETEAPQGFRYEARIVRRVGQSAIPAKRSFTSAARLRF